MTAQTKAMPWTPRKSCALLSTCVPIILAAALIALAQEHVARVVDLRGDWFLNSSQKLSAGMPLPASGIVQVRNPKYGDYIAVANRSGKIIESRNCDNRCDEPINLPTTSSPSVFFRLFEAAMDLLSNGREKWVVLISKGGELREAVVKIEGKQVDLSTVLQDQHRGKYILRFQPHRPGRTVSSKIVGPITVDWNPSNLAPVVVKGLSPGLYMVQPLDNSGRKPLEPGSESLVLFATPETFDKAADAFHEATELTNLWGDQVQHGSKRQFLRAALGVIASETQ